MMKKLIALLIIALAAGAFIHAQVITLSSVEFYDSYKGTSADTAKGTTAKTFSIKVDKEFMYYYDVSVKADSSGDGTNFSVQLQGSNDNSNWYDVGSAQTWYLTSSDTVLRFNNMTSVSTSTTIAAATDYHDIDYAARTIYHDIDYPARYEYHDKDSVGGGGFTATDTVSIPAFVATDTVSFAAFVTTDTVTVAARTLTETLTEPCVGWRFLRVKFTGAGANARMALVTDEQAIYIVVRRK